MKSDTTLDCVVFQLTSDRERCEIVAVAGDENQTVAAGLIEPFLLHVKAVNEQFEAGVNLIKLETTAEDASTWFTKATLESFVKLVTEPEVLESVCALHDKLLNLEESSRCTREEAASESSMTSVSGDTETAKVVREDSKVPETDRVKLYKKQSSAFSRASADGFSVEVMPSLIRFCLDFEVARFLDICERYMKLCMKKRETEIWLGDRASSGNEVVETSGGSPEHNGEGPQQNGDNGDRRLSVQEKIIMFESKMERRMSADINRTDVQKPMLRRWSLAVDRIPSAEGGETSHEKNIIEVDEDVSDDQHVEPTDGSSELSKVQTEENNDGHKCDDQISHTDSKGRLYEQYQEKRDAKLKDELASKRAERQERLRVMQEALEQRRAEVAKTMRSRRMDPLAEARQRAEKLRAFKAELRKTKEEEEKKRLEHIRSQKLQKKPILPTSPRSCGSTPRQQTKPNGKVPFPVFQRSSTFSANGNQASASNRIRKSCDAVELKQGNGKTRASIQQDKADVGLKGLSKSKDSGVNKLRSMVLRKSVPTLGDRKGGRAIAPGQGVGLKSNGLSGVADTEDIKEVVAVTTENGSSVEGIGIRAPLSSVEDDSPEKNEKNGEDECAYIAPIAISSPVVSM